MKKGIIGKKLGMTQIFMENGTVIPVTVIEAGPCAITQKKTVETDGYDAVQLAFEDMREKHVTKPVIALIAGKNAPKGRSMGHAGAIVSADGTGSAESKEKALKEAGCYIAESSAHVVEILKEIL